MSEYLIQHDLQAALEPNAECPWADVMVLNPAIIQDPKSERIHMLFRASGACQEKWLADKPAPYPIFLGYAYSDDKGKSWEADFSQPALAPELKKEKDKLYITNCFGKKVLNHANGCIEDPRLFYLEGTLYLTVACRLFPPGAYWIKDDQMQCAPEWAESGEHNLGQAASDNVTVTVLYKVDLAALAQKDYKNAFQYVCNLTDPDVSDNRDVFLFPEKIPFQGKMMYALLHRPHSPENFTGVEPGTPPCIFVAYSDNITDFVSEKVEHRFLAANELDWEGNRIGSSWPPIRISDSEWLLPYHGKKDDILGYTQSFMILQETDEGAVVTHRCTDRMMYPRHQWEMPNIFKAPVIFSTAGIVVDGELIISYGAADEKCGIARVDFQQLIDHIRQFPVK